MRIRKSIYLITVIDHCINLTDREWFLNDNPDDKEMRVFDDNINNYYIVFG